jgi:hypothetical protein
MRNDDTIICLKKVNSQEKGGDCSSVFDNPVYQMRFNALVHSLMSRDGSLLQDTNGDVIFTETRLYIKRYNWCNKTRKFKTKSIV